MSPRRAPQPSVELPSDQQRRARPAPTASSDGAPLWPADTWHTVAARAGHRCQCEGKACGRTHSLEPRVAKRCPVIAGGAPLYVVGPFDLSDVQVAQIPASDERLRLLCGPCADGQRRGAGMGPRQRSRAGVPGQTDILAELGDERA